MQTVIYFLTMNGLGKPVLTYRGWTSLMIRCAIGRGHAEMFHHYFAHSPRPPLSG